MCNAAQGCGIFGGAPVARGVSIFLPDVSRGDVSSIE